MCLALPLRNELRVHIGLQAFHAVAHQVGIGVFGPQILHLAFDRFRRGDAIDRPEQVQDVTKILDDGRYAIACVRARVAGRTVPYTVAVVPEISTLSQMPSVRLLRLPLPSHS